MKAIGSKICKTEKVLKLGQKGLGMMVSMFFPKRRVKENTFGQMDRYMKVTGWTIRSMARGFTCGRTVGNIMDNG